ncbi:SWI/SNF-related matrix-associated actin-dependent regulator of chromatin subfamily A member 3-like 1 [Nymphaea thermarum]|nr:SWI/SNF-related matrix-associated actin-dependent regulator of chromatin subfamily A member 3-like 1 [Nymphaea thermarum]
MPRKNSRRGEDASSSHPPNEDGEDATYLAGFVTANIVGLQYYSGRISGREMVCLVREPSNPYDHNAIKVLNTRSQQVGHIERSVAAVLSPLIDATLISIVGIVPQNPNPRNSKNPKWKNPFRVPCQIHIFTLPESVNDALSCLAEEGLSVVSHADPAFSLSESASVREKNPKEGVGTNDDIFASVGAAERKERLLEPSEAIVSPLFLHQKLGLGWLVHRENSLELPPFWEEIDGGKGKGVVFRNVLTCYRTDERPEPLRGGILADDMGLGKTLMLISLIATNRPGAAVCPSLVDFNDLEPELNETKDVAGEQSGKVIRKSATLGRKRKSRSGIDRVDGGDLERKSKKSTASRRKRKLDDQVPGAGGHDLNKQVGPPKFPLTVYESPSIVGPKSTLVVCPQTVISSWITQLEEHTRPGSLKIYLYHGIRTNAAEELRKFDVVFTTYSILATEFDNPSSPIKQMEWLRVILDEAHVVKNVNAKQTKAVIALNSKRRWAVTGTPIQNSSFDLFAFMAFLRFQPFSIKSYWKSLIQNSLVQGNKSGLMRLQALMGTITLRRTKNLISLPPKMVEISYVDLSMDERELYDKMELDAKTIVQEYIHLNSVLRNYSTVLLILLRLRQICDDVSLCPGDIGSLFPSKNLEDVSNNPQLLEKMLATLQDGDDFDCPVCLSPPTQVIITCCSHIFCRACISRVLQNLNPRCPMCRQTLSESDLYSAPPRLSEGKSSFPSSCTSAKAGALLQHLIALRGEDPSIKSVVFSQFQKMLVLLEEPLRKAGFVTVRLDGTMSAKKKAAAIARFSETGPGAPTVMLASLKVAGAGINLTVASRVYLVEPWWNPAVEEQAMDRVHRIGQRQEVRVVRLIVKGSIEERILELQEKKRKLSRGAFRNADGKEQTQICVDDIRTIMSL